MKLGNCGPNEDVGSTPRGQGPGTSHDGLNEHELSHKYGEESEASGRPLICAE